LRFEPEPEEFDFCRCFTDWSTRSVVDGPELWQGDVVSELTDSDSESPRVRVAGPPPLVRGRLFQSKSLVQVDHDDDLERKSFSGVEVKSLLEPPLLPPPPPCGAGG